MRRLFQSGTLGSLSDGDLLERFLEGDPAGREAAFSALVERHGGMVLGVCRRLLGDSHLAEDAFQAAFLVLARRARSLRNREVLGVWLHRVAYRVALRLSRKNSRRKRFERVGVEEEVVAVSSGDSAHGSEVRVILDEEVNRLRDAQRLPVVLCCLEGVSHEEAARRLGWPVGTVKSRLARGRKILQERLTRRGVVPAVASAAVVGASGASASVPAALVEVTARLALTTVGGGVAAGTVPAAVAEMVRREMKTMILISMKLGAGVILAVGAVVGTALVGGPGEDSGAKERGTERGKAAVGAGKSEAGLSASGRVVDGQGRAIEGATVILRERSDLRTQGMKSEELEPLFRGEELPDILAKMRTDAEGRFRFENVPAREFPKMVEGVGRTLFPWNIVAMAPGHGLAWTTLTPARQKEPIVLTLGEEASLNGQVREPDGTPVEGAKVKVSGIFPLDADVTVRQGAEDTIDLSWSSVALGATTDAEGRFSIGGLPKERKFTLVLTEPHHERLFTLAATTDEPQPANVSRVNRGGVVEETGYSVGTSPLALTMKRTDHVLTGRITFESDGKPAVGATIVVGGSVRSQKVGEDGRYRVEELAAGTVNLYVQAPGSDAAPAYLSIEIPEKTREVSRDIVLPKGLELTGRVVDDEGGDGVEGVVVNYRETVGPDEKPSLFAFADKTDAEGRYRIVVPGGRGTVALNEIPWRFVQPEYRNAGKGEGSKFSSEVEGQAGQTVKVPEFRLSRGRVLRLLVVDGEGKPVPKAKVYLRDSSRMFDQKPGLTDDEGRFEVSGLEPEQATILDVIAEDRGLGAVVEVPDRESAAGRNLEAMEARLQPLVTLSGRVLDADGKPLAGPVLQLYRDVMFPGEIGRSFGLPVETQPTVKPDGTYVFDGLIPGATYNTRVEVSGHASATSAHVTAKPGESVTLGDFRLPATEWEVRGVVVNSAGKPVAGVMVSFQNPHDRGQSLYAPNGSQWFQETDEQGRFHLIGLPEGPVKLMAYRNPPMPDQSIQNLTYADVNPGQAEVRITLPDPDDRLRGIE